MPIAMETSAFEALVDQALDAIPDELTSLIENVVVLIEDDAPDDATEPPRPGTDRVRTHETPQVWDLRRLERPRRDSNPRPPP